MMSQTDEFYNLTNIRALLTKGFTDDELRRLCYDVADFRPVYEQVTDYTGKAKIIDQLLEYTERKLLFEVLLGWAEKRNPKRYEIHKPYISSTNTLTDSLMGIPVASGETTNKEKFLFSVSDGMVTEVERISEDIDGLGKIIVKPGNAVILVTETEISRICGPGVMIMGRDEKIRMVFDLRPQFIQIVVENVLTRDRISLTIEIGIGYRIRPASDPDAPSVIKEKNFGLFPVDKNTLLNAAFNCDAEGWHSSARRLPLKLLRDQIMTYKLDDLFNVQETTKEDHTRVNNRQIKLIENAILAEVNEVAHNVGVKIITIDIMEITFPDYIREAINIRIKSQAEAEAIQRIETERNAARSDMVSRILESISTGTGGPIGAVELQLATELAQILRDEQK